MTLQGYPDYARVQLATGYLLAGGQQAFTASTIVFKGYVGPFPYVNSFWDAVSGTGHNQVIMSYYTDDTFTTLIADQISIRSTNIVGYKQYAVMSPWLIISVTPDTFTDHTVCTYAFYGTTQQATSAKLGSLDAAFFEESASIPATSTVPFGITKIYPGGAVVSWEIGSTAWILSLQRWDYGSASWKTFWQQNNAGSPKSGNALVTLPDAMVQVTMDNGDAGAQGWNVFIVPYLSD